MLCVDKYPIIHIEAALTTGTQPQTTHTKIRSIPRVVVILIYRGKSEKNEAKRISTSVIFEPETTSI